MSAIQKLTELFEAKELSAVEAYWALLSTDDFDPEQLHKAAIRLGKTSEDVTRDAELLAELQANPMPDAQEVEKAFRTANKKAQRALEQANDFKEKAGKKFTEAEILRTKAQHDKQEAANQRQRHIRACKALATRGWVPPVVNQ